MPKKDVKNKDKKVKTSKDKKSFIKDTKAELKKVIWPTSKQLLNNTLAVITVVLLIGVIVFALDFCLEKLNSYGVNKLKTIVKGNTVSQQVNNDTADNTDTNIASNELTVNAEATNQTVENAE